jgi:hypothetical protein
MDAESFRFLFRESEGAISAPEWRRWTLLISLICVALAEGWVLVGPWTQRDLATQGLFDLRAFLAFVYLLAFAVAVLLAQVSQYNLTAKRLRAKSLAPGWASVWPLSALAAGSAFWAEPNFFGLIPAALPWLLTAAALAVFVAQLFLLGRDTD